MDDTECISCGRYAPRFRAVVDLNTERDIGVICAECLTDEFGHTIGDPLWRNSEGCAVCDRDAFYGLPEVSITRETRGIGVAISRYNFELDEQMLRVCDEHLALLSGEKNPAQPVMADGGGVTRDE